MKENVKSRIQEHVFTKGRNYRKSKEESLLSSNRADSTEFLDSLSPSVPIIYRTNRFSRKKEKKTKSIRESERTTELQNWNITIRYSLVSY